MTQIGFGKAHSFTALLSLPLLSPLGSPIPVAVVFGSTPPNPTLAVVVTAEVTALDAANPAEPKLDAVVVVLANPARLNPVDVVEAAV